MPFKLSYNGVESGTFISLDGAKDAAIPIALFHKLPTPEPKKDTWAKESEGDGWTIEGSETPALVKGYIRIENVP